MTYWLKNEQYPQYQVDGFKIGYVVNDAVDYDASFGYKTLFDYFKCFGERPNFDNIIENQIGLYLNCGEFSYTEIPSQYALIMGVSGTLDSLSDVQKKYISNKHNIRKITIMPSCYGENKLFKHIKIQIKNKVDYFLCMKKEIDRIRDQDDYIQRPIIIFCKDDEKMREIYFCDKMELLRNEQKIQMLHEKLTVAERNQAIMRAGKEGVVTIATFTFGRGTDFACSDKISNIGGIHVLLADYPKDQSELVQIQGRTARYGQNGSCSFCLTLESLEDLGIEEGDINKSDEQLMQFLMKQKKRQNEIYQKNQFELAQRQLTYHEKTKEFIKNLKIKEQLDFQQLKSFLMRLNKAEYTSKQVVRAIICLDATASMSTLIGQTKLLLQSLFKDTKQVLKTNGYEKGLFQIQFVAYRNYNVPEEKLLQVSPWSTNNKNLENFLQNVDCQGGLQREAIEIALKHVNQEKQSMNINLVFILGDQGANQSMEEVLQKRTYKFDENYWQNAKNKLFNEPTFYKVELQKLIENQIKVHTLCLNQKAKDNFFEISNLTEGICQDLEIQSKEASQIMKDFFAEQILKEIGNQEGDGEKLVLAYQKLQ